MKSMQNFVESPKLIFKIFFAKNVPYEPLLRARGSSKLESDVGAEVARWIQMESDVRWSQMLSDGVRWSQMLLRASWSQMNDEKVLNDIFSRFYKSTKISIIIWNHSAAAKISGQCIIDQLMIFCRDWQ